MVSDSIWSEIASKHIATNLFVGFGHAMHSAGNAGVAGEVASNRTARLVTKAHSANVTVQPLIEYWADGSSASYKTFIRNATKQAEFVELYVADALRYGYDGYNLDWEFGNFTDGDAALCSKFIATFARALAVHGKQVSTCQGSMKYSNTGYVDEPNYRAYSMETYDSALTGFLKELGAGVSKLASRGNSDVQHWGAGLSASSQAWKNGAPTHAELQERFCALRGSGVYYISLFGEQYLEAFQPFLTEFVDNLGEACPLL